MEHVNASYGRIRRYLSDHDAGASDGDLYCVSRRRRGSDPDRYHQRGFVEQYQRKSSISNIRDAVIKEIAEIFVDRRYAGKTVGEVQDEQQLTVFLILRDDLSILPQKDTLLKLNDIIVIRGRKGVS